jgi:alkylation response protein AidB-like acyl-CoA dehydrogenase
VYFEPNEVQQAILDAVAALLEQYAGPARAIELAAKQEYDFALDAALEEAGFSDVALGEESGPLEAALISEAVARAAGVVSSAAAALVATGLLGRKLPGPVALATRGQSGPVRYAAHARTLLVADGDVARIVPLAPGDVEPVPSGYGYPMGRIDRRTFASGEQLEPGSAARLLDWWRLALACETLGTMQACLDVTVRYLSERRQFGRAIGSFQAVQHRLAECAVQVEGTRWLVREAAWHDAPAEQAATVAAYAAEAAARVFRETHQLSGAIGFTREHDLHAWSMRLQPLRLELDGVAAQRRALALERWGAAS